ncbi:MAG: hypothetical protein J6U60_03780 [Clostridia bacterium]|nr:hypothetical protein [Clostridia bacterium]
MKKLLFVILSFTLACCCFLLTGCSKQEVYKFSKLTIEEDDTEFSFEVGDKFEGVRLTEDYATIILDEDKAVLRLCYTETHNEETETYKEVFVCNIIEGINNELYMYKESEEEALIVVKEDKTLTLKYDGMLLVLTK